MFQHWVAKQENTEDHGDFASAGGLFQSAEESYVLNILFHSEKESK